MHIIRKAAAVVSAAAAAGAITLALGAIPASASTTYTATTHLTNRQDSGNNTLGGNVWATDDLTRSATLVDDGPDPNKSGYDTYEASLSDTGTFTTVSGAGNPNGLNATTPITGTVTGSVTGSGTFTKFDVLSTVHADSGLVPATMSGNSVSSGDWPKLFFPSGTALTCPGVELTAFTTESSDCGTEDMFSYTYKSCSEQWLDANTDNDGNAVGETAAEQAIIGGISGKACPSPSPSAPPPSGTVPTGGVQTGGGKPVNSGVPLYGAIAAVIGLALVIGSRVRVRRQRG